MYRALYRKWRPQTFGDVVGQQAITAALANQITAGRVGHAYLFTGTRGTGKTTCAKIFAKAVNCENRRGAEPCGECEPCLGLENGSILDVIEIDAASNNGVDDIRDLRDETAYRPSRCQYKVYIIDEVHMLSTAAFNALLKIMEEPPSHVIFILATTEIHKVPATILSRCQRYDFTRIPAEAMAERLQYIAGEEGIALTPGAAGLIARLADGALRDALSLLDTCAGVGGDVSEELVRQMAGVADKDYLFALSEAVQRQDVGALLALVASLREKSIDIKRLTEELVYHYRNFMLAASGGALLPAMAEEEKQRYLAAAPGVGEVFAIYAVRRLAAAMDKMARSPDPRIELELALFDLSAPQRARPAAQAPVQTAAAPAAVAPVAPVVASAAAPAQAAAPPPVADAPVAPAPAAEAPPLVEEQAPPVAQEEPAAAAPVQPMQAPPVQAQEAPAADGIQPFAAWPQVVERMKESDRMLYSYMKGSAAYFDGRRVLIDGGEMFLSFMREYETAGEKIKAAIQEVTGQRYAIGPYSGGPARKAVTAEDTLRRWEEQGVQVEYE